MTVTFLVEVNLDDISPQALIDEAETIRQDLFSTGLDVISVKPWERPSLGEASASPLGSTGKLPN